MGYSNYFKLTVVNQPTENKEAMVCVTCETSYSMDKRFCPKDGSPLEHKTLDVPVEDIIERFRNESEEAAALLQPSGHSEETGSGYDIKEDLVKFSKKCPDGLFKMDVTWDNGFGDSPSRWYIKNGKIQDCEVETIFEEFNENKLI